ncbi:bifunctional 4-hydroxy-2-oxoglutarate aldolase/2-dehydro-3-deoxy-phosphogluconate aldolase [Staphylococcus equorum]|uniref:bifunctional 4-hydroxy-2-oxoglutarate aldolase/2-dehydro-3-deoxy-phosphogluconate aldolase n=1 Tax=Staphylococcus equorum TaxID=246432 RepID=UPI002DBADE86|nr:bifunctional 4-hydroxy-2-oxoglutarate aldolase/2-dehydro-3-deoxy-phosphogluconate aldolase [Staphylococcus equorum]MEB7846644.1 bifunctional 4-hydroxy-2-oxoglutarate aldolase/2-dehydro-3-deoxy-phosphogluconate aldolase [Staphylococcus equorum]
MLKELSKHKIISIIRGYDTEEVLKIVKVLIEAKIKFIEITLNSPNAIYTIKKVTQHYGKQIYVGAGTVQTTEDCHDAIEAGAKYIISPDTNIEVINYTKSQGCCSIPGALTPTEVSQAHFAGADVIKVFPASVFGHSYIKEIKAPLNEVDLLPTGGIQKSNVKSFIKAGAIGVGISSAIVKSNQNVNKDFLINIKMNAQELIEILEV